MNKVYGLFLDFSYVRKDRTRIVVSYNLKQLEDGVHATWCEIYFYKKQHPYISIEDVKAAIIADINNSVTKKIIEGFEWEDNKVWLTNENQLNYKTAYDLALLDEKSFLPVTFKFGTDEEPVYKTFDTLDDLEDFYIASVQHIKNTIQEGWQMKNSIDWSEYENKLKVQGE